MNCTWEPTTTNYHRCSGCGRKFWRKTPAELPVQECPAREFLRPGLIVDVVAWWSSDALVSCEIISVDPAHATVRPRTGNPHTRWIRHDRIPVARR